MIGWQATRSKQESSSVAVKTESDEAIFAEKIAARISDISFKPYVAVQQTLRGIKEFLPPSGSTITVPQLQAF